MLTVFETMFWLCAFAIGSTYFIYPLFAMTAARLPRPKRVLTGQLPTLSLIVSAYNEAEVIRDKIENALALDYPRSSFELIVISDGSTDATDEIVAEYAARNVRLFRQDPQGGKSRGLTTFVPHAAGQILVFSDANSMYDRGALRALVRHFEDPDVGYVVGHQRYTEDNVNNVSVAERLYWRLELQIKRGETRIGSVVGGDGAIYAVRAELFKPLRDDDISDFVNPLQIIVQGYRGVFEPEAHCTEDVASSFTGEFRRKVRIVNRALRGLCRVPGALNPFLVGGFAFQLLFHKVLRWFVPYFLIGILLANVVLVSLSAGPFYAAILGLQVACYVLASLRYLPVVGDWKIVYVPYYFCLANLASMLGTLGVIRGRRVVIWQPERN